MNWLEHILVVCEDSPNGDLALFTAAALAEQTGARLTVAAIANINMPGHRRCCGSGAMCLNYTEREDADDRLGRTALPVRTSDRNGEASYGIGRIASRTNGASC